MRTQRKFKLKQYMLQKDGRMKIGIVQLGSWGDNINSTLMLEPLKKKYQDADIEIHTASLYSSAFKNNPLISKIHEHQADYKAEAFALYNVIPDMVKKAGYDKVFVPHPIINGDKWTSIKHGELGTNLVCAWVRALEDDDVDYEVPFKTILRLTEDEVKNADDFVGNAGALGKRKILMEIHGESGQTQWNHNWTKAVGDYLLQDGRSHLFISRKHSDSDNQELARNHRKRVHFVGGLSIRECAQVYNHCDVFISVSSGLANACHTDHCRKDVKWYEAVNSPVCSTSVVRSEGKKFYHKDDINGFINLLKEDGV